MVCGYFWKKKKISNTVGVSYKFGSRSGPNFLLGLILVQTVCKGYEQITLADRVKNENELRHEISNNVVCATSKASDQPAHTLSLIKAFASLLTIL